MSPEREEICKKCRMLPSIHHLEYPMCDQRFYPISQEEWEQLGKKPQDEVTVESVERMMDIALMPYCKRKMLNAHPIEWWTRALMYGRR